MKKFRASGTLGVAVMLMVLAGCAGSTGSATPTSGATSAGATVTSPTATNGSGTSGQDGASSVEANPSLSLSLPPTKSAARPPTSVPVPNPVVPPSQTPNPGSQDQSADLTIVIDDGTAHTTTWNLTCSPVGGTHPTPDTACRALAEHGDQALQPVSKDVRCTMIFGGPQRAQITGRWRGQAVNSTFSQQNGCEISRWNMLAGLLPAAGL